jgi:hypothetical protein
MFAEIEKRNIDAVHDSTLPEAALYGQPQYKYGFNWLPVIGLVLVAGFFGLATAYDLSVGSFGVIDAVCGLLTIAPLAFAAYLVATGISKTVTLYERGFALRGTGPTISAGWDDIETMWVDIYKVRLEAFNILARYNLRMRLRDGRDVVLRQPLAQIEEMGSRI